MVQQGTIDGKDVVYEKDQYGTWVAVMNYEHYQNNDPSVTPGSTFPQLPNGKTNSSDVQSSGSNGELKHVDKINQYGNTWDNVDAVRLEATTENHSRKIHYFTENQNVIDAVVQTQNSGEAGASDLKDQTTFYSDHNANLPDAGNNQTSSNSDRIFGYEFPMYLGGTHHWALSGNGNRWEVDDYPNDDSNSTVHRIWVRVPDGTFPIEVNLTETVSVNDFKTLLKDGAVTQIALTEKIGAADNLNQQLFRVIQKTLSETINVTDKTTLTQDQITGYYPFNGNLKDEITGLTGTSYGSEFTTGINNTQGLEFPQASDYTSIKPDSFTDWYNDKSISVSLWIKTTDQGAALGVIEGGKEGNPSSSSGHVPAVAISGQGNGKANISLIWHKNTNWVSSTTTVNDGNWHHIVGTYNASTDTEKVYVDGVEENSRDPGSQQDFNNGDYGYILGTDVGTDSSWGSLSNTNLQGQIDEFRAYAKTLSSSEVTQLYKNQTSQSLLSKKTLKSLNETSSLSDNLQKNAEIFRQLTENLATSETVNKQFEGLRKLSETVNLQDSQTKKTLKKINQTINAEPQIQKVYDGKRQLNESLKISETSKTKFQGFRTLSETLTTSDNLQKNAEILRKIQEKITLTDTQTSLAKIHNTETLQTAANTQKQSNFFRELNETLTLNDSDIKQISKTISQAFTIGDNQSSAAEFSRTQTENLNLEETSTTTFTGFRTLDETLDLNDNLSKTADLKRQISETVYLNETVKTTAELKRTLQESFTAKDKTTREAQLSRKQSETFTVQENVQKTIQKTLNETTTVLDSVNTNLVQTVKKVNLTESLNLSPTTQKESKIFRKLQETLTITDNKTLGGDIDIALRRIALKKGLVENLAEILRKFNEAKALNPVNSYTKQTSPRTAETLVNANKYKSEKRKYNTVEQK